MVLDMVQRKREKYGERDFCPHGSYVLTIYCAPYLCTYSSFQMDSTRWQIAYADTSQASGILGVDDVTVAGIKISNQTFGLASYNAAPVPPSGSSGFDGIMGLGFEGTSDMKGTDHCFLLPGACG